eukprot:219735-Pleurochrysis_carterae.AAC.1
MHVVTSLVRGGNRHVADDGATLRLTVDTYYAVLARSLVYKVRCMRMDVPSTPTVDDKTDTASSVAQASATPRSVTARS